MRIRGFAGLPDGSKWVLDEIVGDPSAVGGELARRMKLARADDLLREAEEAAAA